ncbi:MAG: hypothetical protein MJE68_02445, partial [Proteobacteria bacterium]|nr:hypothetical protein [Pseudomonadota bacterium]
KLNDSWFFVFEVVMIGAKLAHLISIQGVGVNIALLYGFSSYLLVCQEKMSSFALFLPTQYHAFFGVSLLA